jgi:hypothetical protein
MNGKRDSRRILAGYSTFWSKLVLMIRIPLLLVAALLVSACNLPGAGGAATSPPAAAAPTRNPDARTTTSDIFSDPTTDVSVRNVAEPFIQALLQRNLEGVAQYYEPSIRPTSWSDIIPTESISGIPSDFSGCIGTRPIIENIPDTDTVQGVSFRFPTDCVLVPTPTQADQNVVTMERYNGLGVRLQKFEGRWWVTGFGAFRRVA